MLDRGAGVAAGDVQQRTVHRVTGAGAQRARAGVEPPPGDRDLLVALNKGVKLPNQDITVVARSDGSGTTFIFTNYLSKVSAEWKDKAGNDCTTQWNPFSNDTKYYEPSKKDFMFNYRVENLEELLKTLKEEGVTIIGEIQEFEYGKFGWIMDCDGNKIELWEPVDKIFTDLYKEHTTK